MCERVRLVLNICGMAAEHFGTSFDKLKSIGV